MVPERGVTPIKTDFDMSLPVVRALPLAVSADMPVRVVVDLITDPYIEVWLRFADGGTAAR